LALPLQCKTDGPSLRRCARFAGTFLSELPRNSNGLRGHAGVISDG